MGFLECHKDSKPVCKLTGGAIAVIWLALAALNILLIWCCRIRVRRNRVPVAQRDREDAAEAAEATPQTTARPHIRVRVAEPLLPHIDKAETLPLYDLDVVGTPLSKSSEAVTAGYDYYNNHRRILLDPEGNPLDDPRDSTAHEERTESNSPPLKPFRVSASSGVPLELPPDFRSESARTRTKQSEPPAYPPPVYSVGRPG